MSDKPTMTEIKAVVEIMFEQSEHDITHAQCIQYYPALIEKVEKLEQRIENLKQSMNRMHQHASSGISDDRPCPIWAEKFEQEYLDALKADDESSRS